ITVRDDEPVPVTQDQPPFELTIIDFAGQSGAEPEAESLRMVEELTRRPFDLSRDPLLRAPALVLAADDHLLLLETHHIAFVGWSERLLLDELTALYAGLDLPEPPLPFGDFALWQRSRPL